MKTLNPVDLEIISVECVSVQGRPGSEVNDCIREAIKLAATEWRNVELRLGTDVYLMNVIDLFGVAKKKPKKEA